MIGFRTWMGEDTLVCTIVQVRRLRRAGRRSDAGHQLEFASYPARRAWYFGRERLDSPMEGRRGFSSARTCRPLDGRDVCLVGEF